HFFFFSSRRRHTRSTRDWSSDVCSPISSILFLVAAGLQVVFGVQKIFNLACGSFYALGAYVGVSAVQAYSSAGGPPWLFIVPLRSEERRVGTECGRWWGP